MKLYWDVKQNTPEWLTLRMGRPTASRFSDVMTPKKMQMAEARHKYACELVAERLLYWQKPDISQFVRAISDGKEREPDAIRQLEFVHEIQTRPIGFATPDHGRWGGSPDRMIEATGTPVEVKCPTDPVHLQYMLLGFEDAYRCQVQGQIAIVEADKSLFYSYNPRMPECLVRTDRDQPFIDRLMICLDQFADELDAMTERAKSLGIFQAYEWAEALEQHHKTASGNATALAEAVEAEYDWSN